jgi:hypothetical protein
MLAELTIFRAVYRETRAFTQSGSKVVGEPRFIFHHEDAHRSILLQPMLRQREERGHGS